MSTTKFEKGEIWVSPKGHRFHVVTVNGDIVGMSAINGPSYFQKPSSDTKGWKRIFPYYNK